MPAVTADSPCYLQFSSGSTRFPAGVLVTAARRNLLFKWNLLDIKGDVGARAEEISQSLATVYSLSGPALNNLKNIFF